MPASPGPVETRKRPGSPATTRHRAALVLSAARSTGAELALSAWTCRPAEIEDFKAVKTQLPEMSAGHPLTGPHLGCRT